MPHPLLGALSLVGRALLIGIFLSSALASDVPEFDKYVGMMRGKNIPYPEVALVAAIAFKVLGSVLVLVGFHARFGALLLFLFLIPASIYFHNFWDLPSSSEAYQQQMVHFMKNAGLLGAMFFIMGNGAGRWSIDNWRRPGTSTS